MTVSVVIPTKNRIKNLYDCLKTIECQIVKPDEVIIVCDSDDEATRNFFENLSISLNIIYIMAQGGTCKKRNLGIHRASSEIILFLDDDVYLKNDYIYTIKKLFGDPHINVVTGYIFDSMDLKSSFFRRKSEIDYLVRNRNDEFVKLIVEKVFLDPKNMNYYYKDYFFRKLRNIVKAAFLMEWPIKGKILPSGFRSEMPDLDKFENLTEVEWFYGVFAARKAVLAKFMFNESLEKCRYALNEDLELSARIGMEYKILLCSDLKLLHFRSPSGIRLEKDDKYFSITVSAFNISQLRGRREAFIWTTCGLLLSSVIKSSYDRSSISEIKGVIRGLRNII